VSGISQKSDFCPVKNKSCDPFRRIVLSSNPTRYFLLDLCNSVTARCYAETCFQKFVGDNLQPLRELAEADLIKEFTHLKLNLRQGFVSTGMGDVQTKMLTPTEANKRKAHQVCRAKKQQKRLLAEQPRATACAA